MVVARVRGCHGRTSGVVARLADGGGGDLRCCRRTTSRQCIRGVRRSVVCRRSVRRLRNVTDIRSWMQLGDVFVRILPDRRQQQGKASTYSTTTASTCCAQQTCITAPTSSQTSADNTQSSVPGCVCSSERIHLASAISEPRFTVQSTHLAHQFGSPVLATRP